MIDICNFIPPKSHPSEHIKKAEGRARVAYNEIFACGKSEIANAMKYLRLHIL